MRRPGAVLFLLHVIPEVEAQFWKSYIYEVDNIDAEARRRIDDKVTQTYLARVPAGVEVKVEYRVGPEAASILEFAEAQRIDLIVIGRHGHSGVQAGKPVECSTPIVHALQGRRGRGARTRARRRSRW